MKALVGTGANVRRLIMDCLHKRKLDSDAGLTVQTARDAKQAKQAQQEGSEDYEGRGGESRASVRSSVSANGHQDPITPGVKWSHPELLVELNSCISSLTRIPEFITTAQKDDIHILRQFLLKCSEACGVVQKHLETVQEAGKTTSRMCYLKTVSEAFLRPEAEAGRLEKEWDSMCEEYRISNMDDRQTVPSLAECIRVKYAKSINERIQAGWAEHHAVSYVVLSSVYARGPMAHALEQKDPRFAASAYALMDALQSRVRQPFEKADPHNTLSGEDHGARFYRNLRHAGGLIKDDVQWGHLETVDDSGFNGFTANAMIRPTREHHYFEQGGWRAQVCTNVYVLQQVCLCGYVGHREACAAKTSKARWSCLAVTLFNGCPCLTSSPYSILLSPAILQHNRHRPTQGDDIVAFDNLPHDDQGYHHGISVSEKGHSVAYPPYTLVALKRTFQPGTWTAPGGVRCASAWI